MKNQYIRSILAAFACASVAAHAQLVETYSTVPGRVFRETGLIDPFSSDPSRPNIFFGGPATDNGGCSIKLISPNANLAACSDPSDSGVAQLAFDPTSSRLYSVGTFGSPGTWQVRASGDGGSTWETVKTFSLGQSSRARGIAVDSAGNVFVCGAATDLAGDSNWIVERLDTSGTWTTIRNRSERRKGYAAEKAHFANGYLFVVGQVAGVWAVERLNLLNNTWDVSVTSPAPKGKSAGPVALTSWGTDIYVLGWVGSTAEAPEQCVLQRSVNNGSGPWQTVKTFAESININLPSDIACDSHGNLYVVGHSTFFVPAPGSTKGSYVPTWIVRTHSVQYPIADGWQTSLPLSTVYDQPTYARGICPDAFGDVYVVGQVDTYANSTFSSRDVLVQKWTMP